MSLDLLPNFHSGSATYSKDARKIINASLDGLLMRELNATKVRGRLLENLYRPLRLPFCRNRAETISMIYSIFSYLCERSQNSNSKNRTEDCRIWTEILHVLEQKLLDEKSAENLRSFCFPCHVSQESVERFHYDQTFQDVSLG